MLMLMSEAQLMNAVNDPPAPEIRSDDPQTAWTRTHARTHTHTSSTVTRSDLHSHQSSSFVSFLVVNDSSVGEGALDWGGTLPLCANWTKHRETAPPMRQCGVMQHLPTSANPHVLLRYVPWSKLIMLNSNLTHYFQNKIILKSSKNVLLKL